MEAKVVTPYLILKLYHYKGFVQVRYRMADAMYKLDIYVLNFVT